MFSCVSQWDLQPPQEKIAREIEKSTNLLDASSSEAALRSKKQQDLGACAACWPGQGHVGLPCCDPLPGWASLLSLLVFTWRFRVVSPLWGG